MVSGLKLSNSAMEAFWKCPEDYNTRYQLGLDQDSTPDYFVYGQRFHERLEAFYRATYTGAGIGVVGPAPDIKPEIEAESLAMLEAYKSHWPQESFTCIDFEKRFEIQSEEIGFVYIGRLDMVVKDKSSGKLQVFETKTESRSSKRNLPQSWIARHQASLYLWAASKIYKEPIDTLVLNICTKGSMGKQLGPTFRRDNLHRTPKQIKEAIDSANYVARSIKDLNLRNEAFPRNTSNCISPVGWTCPFYSKCHMESQEGLKAVEPFGYLSL